MKRKLILMLGFVLIAGALFAQPSEVINLKMKSEILGTEKDYSVYLPQGYEKSGKSYPVLYLLHGAWGDHTDWHKSGDMKTITDEAISSGKILPMIVVMPDAKGIAPNKAGKNMGYFNMNEWAYEDYFFTEFITYIDKTYRTKSEKKFRAISGLSMGGGGTTVYAQRHPDVFGSACSLSGLVGETQASLASRLDPEFAKSVLATNPTEFVRNATSEQIETLKSVRWYFDCGDDDFLYKGNLEIYLAMREKKIPVEYRMRNGGHNWYYWRSALPEVLTFISVGFAE